MGLDAVDKMGRLGSDGCESIELGRDEEVPELLH